MTYEEVLEKVEQLEKENKELNEKLWKKSKTIMQILDRSLEFFEEIERLEKENKEMKSIVNKFCAKFMCREYTQIAQELDKCYGIKAKRWGELFDSEGNEV